MYSISVPTCPEGEGAVGLDGVVAGGQQGQVQGSRQVRLIPRYIDRQADRWKKTGKDGQTDALVLQVEVSTHLSVLSPRTGSSLYSPECTIPRTGKSLYSPECTIPSTGRSLYSPEYTIPQYRKKSLLT